MATFKIIKSATGYGAQTVETITPDSPPASAPQIGQVFKDTNGVYYLIQHQVWNETDTYFVEIYYNASSVLSTV